MRLPLAGRGLRFIKSHAPRYNDRRKLLLQVKETRNKGWPDFFGTKDALIPVDARYPVVSYSLQ